MCCESVPGIARLLAAGWHTVACLASLHSWIRGLLVDDDADANARIAAEQAGSMGPSMDVVRYGVPSAYRFRNSAIDNPDKN